MIKSGAEHIASLRDGRAVYLHGQSVADVTTHPAYANAVKTTGRLFDFAREQPELMSFVADNGERANRIWQLPTTYEELVGRRKALEAWNGLHEACRLDRKAGCNRKAIGRCCHHRRPGRHWFFQIHIHIK